MRTEIKKERIVGGLILITLVGLAGLYVLVKGACIPSVSDTLAFILFFAPLPLWSLCELRNVRLPFRVVTGILCMIAVGFVIHGVGRKMLYSTDFANMCAMQKLEVAIREGDTKTAALAIALYNSTAARLGTYQAAGRMEAFLTETNRSAEPKVRGDGKPVPQP